MKVGSTAGNQISHSRHQRDRGDDHRDTDDPRPARRLGVQIGVVVRVVAVVVVEPGIDRHVRTAEELLRLGRRIGLRVGGVVGSRAGIGGDASSIPATLSPAGSEVGSGAD